MSQVRINEEWIMAKVKMLEDENARLRAALSEREGRSPERTFERRRSRTLEMIVGNSE